jgi:hypothetical protein
MLTVRKPSVFAIFSSVRSRVLRLSFACAWRAPGHFRRMYEGFCLFLKCDWCVLGVGQSCRMYRRFCLVFNTVQKPSVFATFSSVPRVIMFAFKSVHFVSTKRLLLKFAWRVPDVSLMCLWRVPVQFCRVCQGVCLFFECASLVHGLCQACAWRLLGVCLYGFVECMSVFACF